MLYSDRRNVQRDNRRGGQKFWASGRCTDSRWQGSAS